MRPEATPSSKDRTEAIFSGKQEQLLAGISVLILHIIKETSYVAQKKSGKTFGPLAETATISMKLFNTPFRKKSRPYYTRVKQ